MAPLVVLTFLSVVPGLATVGSTRKQAAASADRTDRPVPLGSKRSADRQAKPAEHVPQPKAERMARPKAEGAAQPGAQRVARRAAGAPARPESKKERFLREKRERHDVHLVRAPRAGTTAIAALTIRNVWTHEVLPLDLPPSSSKRLARSAPSRTRWPATPGVPLAIAPSPAVVNEFLRDHFTNQETRMDPRLIEIVLRAAAHFHRDYVEVVSGYRSPKYNLMLRKKGHAVARESQHPLGHAVDFRLPGLRTRDLYRFVRTLRIGGAGYYPHSEFVHADVGRVRFWYGY